jgi:hypothetical protein
MTPTGGNASVNERALPSKASRGAKVITSALWTGFDCASPHVSKGGTFNITLRVPPIVTCGLVHVLPLLTCGLVH